MDYKEMISNMRKYSAFGLPPEECKRVATAIETLLAEREVKGWISVEERLPEDDLPKNSKRKMIRCIVATDKGTVKTCVRQRWVNLQGEMVRWEWNKDLFAKPTHWMPLPMHPDRHQTGS